MNKITRELLEDPAFIRRETKTRHKSRNENTMSEMLAEL